MASTSFVAAGRGRAQRLNLSNNLGAAGKQAIAIARSVGNLAETLGAGLGTRPMSAREMLDAVGLTGVPLPSLAKARSCRLPSCDCPSPDLGEIRRVIERPERVEIAVRLRNTTGKQREYKLDGGAIETETGDAAGQLVITPDQLTLEPGDTAVVRFEADASKFADRLDHAAAIKISAENCDPMRLAIVIRVEPEVAVVPVVDLHCCCTPKVRPLRWYHHYYCDPAPQRTPTPPTDADPRPTPQPAPQPPIG